jgi:D-aminoacyl-tRNA deacylase
MILIVASNKDVASLNIQKQMLSQHRFEKISVKFHENPVYESKMGDEKVRLLTLNEEPIYSQNLLDFQEKPKLVIFISRHSSLSGTPTLSVHAPGNLGEAELGGVPRKISIAPAYTMKDTLKAMLRSKEEMQLAYDVSYECTHHGPSLDVPAMFAELGSSLEQWKDVKAAEAVAIAVIEAVLNFGTTSAKAVIGIGGPHYNSKFSRMALENGIAFGHMIPKYAIPLVNIEMLKQCMEKTLEKVDRAILDWKGIKGEHKHGLARMLQELDLPFEKV